MLTLLGKLINPEEEPPISSPIRVARTASGHMPVAFSPIRSGRALDPHPLDYAVTRPRGDFRQQLALEQTELGRPGRRTRANGQFAILEDHRLGVFGDVFADEPRPMTEHLAVGELRVPSTLDRDPGGDPAQRLRVPRICARP
jgi:hypothetical protein